MKTIFAALWIAVLFPACSTPGLKRAPAQEAGNFPRLLAISQGVTNDRQTQISIVYPARMKLEIQVSEADRLIPESEREVFSYPQSEWRVLRLRYKELSPAETYRLQVTDTAASPPGIVDVRTFSALDTAKTSGRMTLVSCINDRPEFEPAFPLGAQMGAEDADVIFFLGDNIYADISGDPDPAKLWQRYAEAFNKLPFYKSPRLTPLLAVWDDHDYGINDGKGDYRYKEQSRKTFEVFFAQRPVAGFYERGPGVSAFVKMFGQRFLIMDSRYFRGPKGSGPWGREQENWLSAKLQSSDEPAWILNGSQYYGAYHDGESLEREYPRFFKHFIAKLKKLKAPVVLVSGDRHMAEVMDLRQDLGYPTYELSASGLHSYNLYNNKAPEPNPRRLAGANGRAYVTDFNYMQVGFTKSSGGILNLDITVKTQNGQTSYSRSVTVQKP